MPRLVWEYSCPERLRSGHPPGLRRNNSLGFPGSSSSWFGSYDADALTRPALQPASDVHSGASATEWQVQSRHPVRAQAPQECDTCLRSASRARKTRTPAAPAEMPASTA